MGFSWVIYVFALLVCAVEKKNVIEKHVNAPLSLKKMFLSYELFDDKLYS